MPIVLKSGNLSLLEPSGPVQACNGIALPFIYDWQECGLYFHILSVHMCVCACVCACSKRFALRAGVWVFFVLLDERVVSVRGGFYVYIYI